MFYAGYDDIDTDIAVFETEEERDAWVNDENAVFPRVAYTDSDVFLMDIDTWDEDSEDIWGVRWKINPINE